MKGGNILERTTFTYDHSGHVIASTSDFRGEWVERITCNRRGDDSMEVAVSRTLPDGRTVPVWSLVVAPDGQPARRVAYLSSGAVSFTEFYTDGRVTSMEWIRQGKPVRTEYTYDLDGHGNWIRKSRKGGAVVEQRTITYY